MEVIRRIAQGRDYLEYVWYYRAEDRYYKEYELEFNINDLPKDEPDYWEKLKHQYAGMAMQGILSNPDIELDFEGNEACVQAVAQVSIKLATALVNRLKAENKNE